MIRYVNFYSIFTIKGLAHKSIYARYMRKTTVEITISGIISISNAKGGVGSPTGFLGFFLREVN